MIYLTHNLKGKILDIGGGGEGFIGRAFGEQVVAIDKVQEELDEAPGGFEKVLMDATRLKYEDACFDHVTFFYSLMYMTEAEQKQAITEAARVLKPGGTLLIWDCEFSTAFPEPFCVDVNVVINKETFHTTYGIVKREGQSCKAISQMCACVELHFVKAEENDGQFFLSYEKNEAVEEIK